PVPPRNSVIDVRGPEPVPDGRSRPGPPASQGRAPCRTEGVAQDGPAVCAGVAEARGQGAAFRSLSWRNLATRGGGCSQQDGGPAHPARRGVGRLPARIRGSAELWGIAPGSPEQDRPFLRTNQLDRLECGLWSDSRDPQSPGEL